MLPRFVQDLITSLCTSAGKLKNLSLFLPVLSRLVRQREESLYETTPFSLGVNVVVCQRKRRPEVKAQYMARLLGFCIRHLQDVSLGT